MTPTIYDFKATNSRGEVIDFADYKGKAILIVNTASKCGLTPQFKGLEELHQKYQDKGLLIFGFPSGDFMNQELENANKAEDFCQINYGVTFNIMQKVHVNGPETEPIFKFLKSKARGFIYPGIKWNFTKFLISPDGQRIKRYGPFRKPSSLERQIKRMLNIK